MKSAGSGFSKGLIFFLGSVFWLSLGTGFFAKEGKYRN